MKLYLFVLLSAMFGVGLGANFFVGEINASALGDSVVLEQELSSLNSSSDSIKPHRGSGR